MCANMNFYYGKPNDHSWRSIAEQFAHSGSFHTEKTSSLPLLQFWRDEVNVESLIKACPDSIKAILNSNPRLCFEYPVPAQNGKGKSSMTDLMILGDKGVVAVEAKYTECRKPYSPKISTWLKTNGKIDKNKQDVLEGWLEYIKKFGALTDEKIIAQDKVVQKQIPYQLLHRIASACTAAKPGGEAYVLYHLFWDSTTHEKMRKFADSLFRQFKELDLQNGKTSLIVVSTEVSSLPDATRDKGKLRGIVREMMDSNHLPYSFGKTERVYPSQNAS